jgi:hypothetical protein
VSSPKYVARIRRDVQAAIAGWQLSREMLVGVYTRLLTELPAAPDRHLLDPITPPNLWAYRFTLGKQSSRYLFSFAVERRDYVGELHVLEARLTIQGQ